MPSCEHLLTFNIPRTNSNIGLGQTNEIVAGRGDTSTILKYKYSKSKYIEVWKKNLPSLFNWNVQKFITPSGNIILHEECVKTAVFTKGLKKMCEHDATDMSLLNVSDDRFLYANVMQLEDKSEVVVQVYSNPDHQLLHTLRTQNVGSNWIRHQVKGFVNLQNGNIIVCQRNKKIQSSSLEIFTDKGTIILNNIF